MYDDLILKLTGLPSTAYNKEEINTLLFNYVQKMPGRRLLSNSEADKLAEAVTRTTFEEELSKKINTSDNERLITADEAEQISKGSYNN